MLQYFRRNRISASDSAYSYTFLSNVVCRLSVVFYICALCLDRQTWRIKTRSDFLFYQLILVLVILVLIGNKCQNMSLYYFMGFCIYHTNCH